jgi:hypothetical protein
MTKIRDCVLSLGCVWLADLINEKGWRVTNYFGTDSAIKAHYDRRPVVRAETLPQSLKLTVGLINRNDMVRRIRTLEIPFHSSYYANPRFFMAEIDGTEIIAIHWEEIWPQNNPWISLIELQRP